MNRSSREVRSSLSTKASLIKMMMARGKFVSVTRKTSGVGDPFLSVIRCNISAVIAVLTRHQQYAKVFFNSDGLILEPYSMAMRLIRVRFFYRRFAKASLGKGCVRYFF